MEKIFYSRAKTLLIICVFVLAQACTSTEKPAGDTRYTPEDRPEEIELVACNQQIRQADCAWQGSYPHVRQQHCEVSCQQDNESAYDIRFIDNCSNSRLEDVCYTTVQHPTCQYYIDNRGRFVVTANLGILVGTDRNNRCANSQLSTVVLDQNRRVVTMFPGQ